MLRGPAICVLLLSLLAGGCDGNGGGNNRAAPDDDGGAPAPAANQAPAGLDGTAETDEDTPVTFEFELNDADDDPLTVEIVEDVSNGTLTVATDGVTFAATYTPNADFNGTDRVTITVSDGTDVSGPITADITVNPVNDAPVALASDAATDEDAALSASVSGTDVDADALSFAVLGGPAQGVVDMSSDGNFLYTPNSNFNGSDSFTFTASDGVATSAAASVQIRVAPANDAPAAGDDHYAALEDVPLAVAAAGVLANDSDVDGDPLTASLTTPPSNGAVALNPDGSFIYTPNPDFAGIDTFEYAASDGQGGMAAATVVVTIQLSNDLPVAIGLSASTSEDTGLELLLSGSDVDGDTLAYTIVQAPANGTIESLDAVTGMVTYLPAADFNGQDSFTYAALDTFSQSSPAPVSIAVLAVNDAPAFTSDPAASATEGTAYRYDISANDVDNGDDLSIESVTALPGWLSLTDNGDGTAVLAGTPANGDVGTVSIALLASDSEGASDTQNFELVVTNANEAPEFTSVPVTSAEEDGRYEYTLTTTDPDAGDTRSLTPDEPLPAWLGLLDNGDGTGLLLGLPTEAEIGPHAVSVRVTDADGLFAVQSFTLTVTAVNDAPVFTSTPVTNAAQDGTYSYFITTSDEDSTLRTLQPAAPLPSWLGLLDQDDGTGILLGIPSDDDIGEHQVDLQVTDDEGAFSVQSFTLTVTEANAAPVFQSTPVTDAAIDATYAYDVLATDAEDPTGPALAPVGTLPSWLGFIDLGDGAAKLLGVPIADDAGDYPIEIIATDSAGASTIQSFTLTVGAGSGVQVTLSAAAVEENAPAGTPVGVILAGADAESASYALVAGDGDTGNALFSIEGDVLITSGELDFEASAMHSIRLRAGNTQRERVFEIDVLDVNEPPEAIADRYASAVGNTLLAVGRRPAGEPHVGLAGSVLGNDIDPEGATLRIETPGTIVTDAGGEVILGSGGDFIYLPPAGFLGADRFAYSATDGTFQAAAEAEIEVSGMVWYVGQAPATGASGGDGRSSHPFSTLAAASGAAAPGDTIFVHAGAHEGGIVLQDDQRLVGQGAALVIDGAEIYAPGATPTIRNAQGAAIDLARNNVIAGIDVSNAQHGIVGQEFGDLSIGADGSAPVSIQVTGGAALSLHGGTVNARLADVTAMDSASSGIALTELSDASTIHVAGATTVLGARGIGIDIEQAGGTLVLGRVHVGGSQGMRMIESAEAQLEMTSLDLSAHAGPALQLERVGGLAILENDNFLDANGGAALSIIDTPFDADGLRLVSVSATGGEHGIELRGVGAGGFTITGRDNLAGSGGAIRATTATAIVIEDAANVTLNLMRIEDSGGYGIHAIRAENLIVDRSELSRLGDEPGEQGIQLDEVTGDNAITATRIDGAAGDAIQAWNTTHPMRSLHVADVALSGADAGIRVQAGVPDGGIASVTLENASIDAMGGTGVIVQTLAEGTPLDVHITGSRIAHVGGDGVRVSVTMQPAPDAPLRLFMSDNDIGAGAGRQSLRIVAPSGGVKLACDADDCAELQVAPNRKAD